MNQTKLSFKLVFAFLFFTSQMIIAKTFKITPTGGDDSKLIQQTLDAMRNGDLIELTGDFRFSKTIYLPSNITWVLDGKLTLQAGSVLDRIGYKEQFENYQILVKSATGISEKGWDSPNGSTNITMIGGTYDGAYQLSDGRRRVRLIHFSRVTNSTFINMHITKASDDCFTLGVGCNNNTIEGLLGDYAGLAEGSTSGNGLTDKGDHNTWINCAANNCTSDGWTPKCRFSKFIDCKGNNNKGPGWGMYCRTAGARDLNGKQIDKGETISDNQFIRCEAIGNKGSGFSFNVSGTSGEGSECSRNFMQGIAFNNKESGVRFRNKMANSKMEDNVVDILVYNNAGLNKEGEKVTKSGGLSTEDSSSQNAKVVGITGVVVAFNGANKDVNFSNAFNSSITLYQPTQQNYAVIDLGHQSNTVKIKNFSCNFNSNQDTPWAIKEYIKRFCDPIISTEDLRVWRSDGRIRMKCIDKIRLIEVFNLNGDRVFKKNVKDRNRSTFRETEINSGQLYILMVTASNGKQYNSTISIK